MKAIVYTEYGPPDVLHLQEVAKPSPKDNQVLVKIHAAALNAADWHLMRAEPFMARFFSGLLRPKFPILGADMSGRVEAVGRDVRQFKDGDEVFGDLAFFGCGAFGEYACVPEIALAPKPANLSFEEAAAVPLSGVSALQGLRDVGRIQAGQDVLIQGAGGGVGTFAVQIAKSFGAKVTGVCGPGNLDLVRSLGADEVIDYTKEDFTRNGRSYDLILAVNGYHPLSHYKRALKPKGAYIMVGGSGSQMFEALMMGPWYSLTGDKKLGNVMAKSNQKDLLTLKELVEAGKVKPVIDRRYPLSDVPAAMRYLEEGHAKGKIVIQVAPA